MPCFTLDGFVEAVFLGGCGEGFVAADFACEAHGRPAYEVCDRVVEPVRSDRIPCAEEDDVAHEDFVFEGCAEVTFGFG